MTGGDVCHWHLLIGKLAHEGALMYNVDKLCGIIKTKLKLKWQKMAEIIRPVNSTTVVDFCVIKDKVFFSRLKKKKKQDLRVDILFFSCTTITANQLARV